MNQPPTGTTLDLAQLRLRLRSDLRINARHTGDDSTWIVEDPLRGKFYEIGSLEQQLLAALDGRRTLAEVLATLQPAALDLADANIIVRWLIEHELVQVLDPSGKPLRSAPRNSPASRSSFNPLMCELISFNPGPWLAGSQRFVRQVWSWPGAMIWLALAVTALVKLAEHMSGWLAASTQVLDPGNWLRLGLVWAGLKFVHELGHALASERFGAAVSRAGLKLMMFAPVAFVDVTASWRLANRWQRIAIAASGMLVELAVTFVAVLLWTPGSSSLFDRLCVDIALLAGGHTLLFNLNPLMRFDGYFMLTDLLGITNLAAEGSRHVTRLRRHWFGGVELPPLADSTARARGLLIYGLLAVVWRGVMLLTMIAGLVAKWESWGIVASAVLCWFWFGGALMFQTRSALDGRATRRARRRQVLANAGASLLLIAMATWLASPARVESPGVVEYAPLTLLRADARGFVESVAVDSGQTVEPGELLVVIRNDDLTLELQQLQAQREQTALQARLHLQQQELAQQQTLLSKLTSLDDRHAELLRQRDALTVRAPCRGTVVTRDLAALVGRYVKQGDVLLSLGDDEQKELIVSVVAADEHEYVAAVDHSLSVYRPASHGRSWRGTLAQVEPRARYELPHEALGANTGGSVVVRLATASATDEKPTTFQSLAPRLIAKVALDRETSRSLYAGERVTVAFRAAEQSCARRWFESLSSYLHQLARNETVAER